MAKAKSGAGRLAWTSAPPDAPGWYWLQGGAEILALALQDAEAQEAKA